MKTAWVFPGQGSQALGMGVDLLETEEGKAKFTEAESILGWSVIDVCQSDETKLGNTRYTQPCLYVIETILVDLLKKAGKQPDLVAGHSLGEYVALYTAGVFDFTTGLKLVDRRSQLMETASGGKMVALIGFDRPTLTAAIQETDGVVLANDNSEGQVVISGTPQGVESLLGNIKVKRAIPLNVSGAFHSPYMAEAAGEYGKLLDTVLFQDAQIPVLSNVEPIPNQESTVLHQRLSQQMTGPVRWREIMHQLQTLAVDNVLEIGPGKVLSGLIKREFSQITVGNISSLGDLV
jgi:[acyl-carrier-protein] S-malonyltransferase